MRAPTLVDGRVPLIVDAVTGRIVSVLPPPDEHFLLYGGLSTGVGTSVLPLDRGNPGPLHIVRAVRRGRAVHLESLARDLGVGGPPLPGSAGDRAQRRAVEDAFARSVLAVLPVVDDERSEWSSILPARLRDATFVDLTPLAAADVFDIAGVVSHGADTLRGPLPDAVPYTVDPSLSTADPAATRGGAEGVVLAGVLVFTTARRPPDALRAVVPDARSFVVEQRVVIRPFPRGFAPRAFHPRSGTYGKRRLAPARITENRALSLLRPAFRTDRPIVFSVDPAIPEPFRSAVVDGGGWWGDAFEAAGLPGVYSVEVRRDEADPWETGVNPVWWVHRAQRGWSMGHAVSDPSTGEILRGSVRLGAQRIAQLRTLFEALVAPFGADDEAERLDEIGDALVARVRQLAAHEIGHALGFVHNYASTEHPSPSVMDYPHPVVSLDSLGRPSLRGAYRDGLGEWDRYLVAHNYGPAEAAAGLRDRTTLRFLTDADGHAPAAASPHAVPWTLPLGDDVGDVFAALERVLEVRTAALLRFGPAVAPPDADASEIENRFGLLHLLHRFEVARVARLLGGVDHAYALAAEVVDDPRLLPSPVPAGLQRRALRVLAPLVSTRVAAVHPSAGRLLASPSIRHVRGDAVPAAGGRLGPLADEEAHAQAAVSLVAAEVFEVARLNRLSTQRQADEDIPGIEEIAAALFAEADGIGAEALRRHLLHALGSGRLTLRARRSVLDALDRAHSDASPASLAVAAVSAGDQRPLARLGLPPVPAGAPL
ncbi:zinc-dependent metalloprotease [Microbacterium betulae]|uniref:Zinc-dependent metalloprotease n=1 Tax=Microbacterium betulae TaxID=2981139 RepID=A0AA97FH58_9MICO|nr:zinc-dependent metalloprotease [Microbacterium sp. AB]WOF22915.1 zinc-dependent metalloprotease [Microbacterium sp. AB]